MEEYKKFMQQSIIVVTVGKITHENYYNVGNSLQLEGILDNETDTQVFLKDMHTIQDSYSQFEIKTPYGAVSKDKIISLYLTPTEKKE